jgi:hypothetical protein
VVQSAPHVQVRERKARLIDGASFILDIPPIPPAVWGQGTGIAWARGEALLIVGGNGVGKTTLASQLLRGRLGLTSMVLGLPVVPGDRRVLYLTMDRPEQIRRALHRLFSDDERDVLAGRLVVWQGPPPEDLAANPGMLAELCRDADADSCIVDSLKDAAVGLSEDAVGAGWNRARQGALASGVQLAELHHNRKRGANDGPPRALADVYGSAWITAGVGSVVALHGEAGDPIVELRHLKQPMDELGPWQVQHDHDAGISSIVDQVDLFALAARPDYPLTATAAAVALYGTDKPTRAQIAKARRQLDRLVKEGVLVRTEGGRGAGHHAVYEPAAVILQGIKAA